MGPQDVDVVILNYRTARLAVDAARSAWEDGATSAVVVDNHSGDDSVHILQRELGDVARILPMARNGGFAYGNNGGARIGDRPLVLFMNSDVTLCRGALSAMVRAFDRDPSIGAVAPALYYPDDRPQASAYLFITPVRIVKSLLGMDKLADLLGWGMLSANIDRARNGTYSGQVESLYGSCFLVRRKAFEEVGGFDESFFVGGCDETDLMVRLAGRGWKAYRVAEAGAIHHQGVSTKRLPFASLVFAQESLWIYARKHFGFWGKLTTVVACVVGITVRLLLALNASARRRYWAALGFWMGWTSSRDLRKLSSAAGEASPAGSQGVTPQSGQSHGI